MPDTTTKALGPHTAALMMQEGSKKGRSTNNCRLSIDMPEELYDRFAALCRAQGQSKAKTVRAMITDLLDATGY